MTDPDAVLVRIRDRSGKPPAYEVWDRKCAEKKGESIVASVGIRVDLTGGESLDTDLFEKSHIRCPGCGRNLAAIYIDGMPHS